MRFILTILTLLLLLQSEAQKKKLQLFPNGPVPAAQAKRLFLNQSPIAASGPEKKNYLYGDGGNTQGIFYFNLPASASTSAGVYNGSILIKTLWSAVATAPGTNAGFWDGTDDYGRSATDGNYTIKVLSSNVTYTWEGTIGNTSDSLTGNAVWHSDNWFAGFSFSGNNVYAAMDYNESWPAEAKFDKSTPQQKAYLMPNPTSFYNATSQQSQFTCTDGINVYWGGFDPFGNTKSFVFATSVSNDAEVTNFANGSSYKCVFGRTYLSVIDTITTPIGQTATASHPTGMAVQQSGTYLFVSHGGLNKIDVVDKTSGAPVTTITAYHNPRSLAIASNDTLWALYGSPDTVQKFFVNASTGAFTAVGSPITGFSNALSISVSPDNTTVIIADGGTNQWVKAYHTGTHANLWTLGSAGGYRSNSVVSDVKFDLTDSIGNKYFTSWVAYAPDGSFWVGDGGNYRAQHYNGSTRAFIERVQWLPRNYRVAVDYNNITRVFAGFLEFQIDYTKSLSPTNGSWILVKNWAQMVPSAYSQGGQQNAGFTNVVTLFNSRTYALINDNSSNWKVVELGLNNALRDCGIAIPRNGTGVPITQLYPDGSLRMTTRYVLGSPIVWTKQSLLSFDGAGNPQWGAAVTLATTPNATTDDPGIKSPVTLKQAPGEITSNNLLLVFDQTNPATLAVPVFHLGAYPIGGSAFQWRIALTTNKKYKGDFPNGFFYDVGNNGNTQGNTASLALAIEHSVFWHYYGEGWKGGETNFFNHIWEDGLIVGQFGVADPPTGVSDHVTYESCFACSGNGFSWQVILDTASGNYFIYQNDESFHAGIPRFKISNLNSISEQSILVTLATSNGLTAQYFNGNDLNNFNVATIRTDPSINFDFGTSIPSGTSITDPLNASVKWSGFIIPQFSEVYTIYANALKGVRVWIDTSLIIDKGDNISQAEYSGVTQTLVAGKRYALRYETTGLGSVYLKWSSPSTSKNFIPTTQLIPLQLQPYNGITDLLYGYSGYPFSYTLQNNLYGWGRNQGEDNTSSTKKWNINMGTRSYGSGMDLFAFFVQASGIAAPYSVTRDLGNNNVNTSWEIKGSVNYSGAMNLFNNGTQYGQYLEVLDINGKVLARFYIDQPGLGSTINIYGNTKLIATGSTTTIRPVAISTQPLDIKCLNGTITISYGPYTAQSDAIIDNTASWQRPKTLRLYYYSPTTAPYSRSIILSNLNFSAQ